MCSNESIDQIVRTNQPASPSSSNRTPSPPTSLSGISTGSSSAIFHQQQQQQHQLHQHNLRSNNTNGSILSAATARPLSMSSMLGNSVVPSGILPPLDHYRLQLYNYAMVERLRCSQYAAGSPSTLQLCPPGYPSAAAAAAAAAVSGVPYGPRFALSMSLFHNRVFQPEEPKPQHSYIGLIAMAILSSPESKLVLSDIYQHILDNYPYFRSRGPGWRNSIRHNLSLNDCFIKAGRSANGKGHFWSIHDANLEDFKKGDFRRRKAQRKVRKHMGLAVDDEGTDSPSPPPLAVTPPPLPQHSATVVVGSPQPVSFCATSWAAAAAVQASGQPMAAIYSQSSRKRQFDVASLLAPDDDEDTRHHHTRSPILLHHRHHNHHYQYAAARHQLHHHHQQQQQQQQNDSTHHHHHHHHQHSNHQHQLLKGPPSKRLTLSTIVPQHSDIEEDIDVVASDVENNNDDDDGGTTIFTSPAGMMENFPKDDETTTTVESPISQPDQDPDLPASSVGGGSSSVASWHGIMQQWPNNFQHLSGAMDPRILGRYYGQYMAAAAAQQAAAVAVASSRRSSSANLDNDLVENLQHQLQQQQQQQQPKQSQTNLLAFSTANDC